MSILIIAAAVLMAMNLFIGGASAGVNCIKTGDCKPLLVSTGGMIFLSEQYIGNEAEWLASQKANETTSDFNNTLSELPPHLFPSLRRTVFVDMIINLIFFIITIFLLYKIGKWFAGSISQEPYIKLAIIVFIFVLFFTLELLFITIVLKQWRIPLSGLYKFMINIFKI